MKANLIKQFNLPSYIKGKTFSEASKAIDKKFDDRNDKVSRETKDALLQRLSEAQEYVKVQQGMQNESQQVPDMMDGQIPEGMEEFMPGQEQPQQEQVNPMQEQDGKFEEGGFMDSGFMDTGMSEMSGAEKAGAIGGAATGLLDIGTTAFGPTGIDTTGRTAAPETQSRGMGAASGALKGAAAGAALGPIGAAVGGVLGGVGGLLGAGKAKRDAAKATHNYALGQNAEIRQGDFAYGGKMSSNKYGNGGPPTKELIEGTSSADTMDEEYFKNKYVPQSNITASRSGIAPIGLATDVKATVTPSDAKEWSGARKGLYKAGQAGKEGVDWLGENAGNIAQYAPVASNLMSLKNLKRGTTERGSRLDNMYQPQVYDQARLQNILSQQNTERALTESSGGDLGALRSNLIGQGAAKTKARSEAMAKGDSVNRDEQRFKFQADSAKDMANVNLDQNFLDRKAKDEGAYQTTKANLKRQLAEDIGGIGREEVDKKLVKELFGYKWNGKYYVDKAGKLHTKQEVEKAAAQAKVDEKSKTKE